MPAYSDKERAPKYSKALEDWRKAAAKGDDEAMKRADADWRRQYGPFMPRSRATIDRHEAKSYGLIGKTAR